MKFLSIVALIAMVFSAVFSAVEGNVYGRGNVMFRRYPNGPDIYHNMPATRFQPAPVPVNPFLSAPSQPVPAVRTNVDHSWMFNNVANRVPIRPLGFW